MRAPQPDLRIVAAQVGAALRRQTAKARTDYHAFVHFCLRDEKGRPVRQGVIHRVWRAHVLACWAAGVHPAIVAPFGHGKTVQCVVGLAAWEVGLDPSIRIKVVGNTDEKARERVTAISNLLVSPAYQRTFPGVRPVDPGSIRPRPKWTEGAILVGRDSGAIDPTVAAHGILASGIGGRADFLLFDDVVDRKNALDEPKLRDKVKGDFDDVWMSRLVPGGRVLYIATPWHKADLTHDLQDRPGWCVLRMPIADDLSCIEMEVYNMPPNYPLERLETRVGRAA